MRNTAGQWWGSRRPLIFRAFSLTGSWGHFPVSLFHLSGLRRVSSGSLRTAHQGGHALLQGQVSRTAAVPQRTLSIGAPSSKGPAGGGGSLAHLRVTGLLRAWPATASHQPLGNKSSADRPGPQLPGERDEQRLFPGNVIPPPVASLSHCLSPPPPPPQTPWEATHHFLSPAKRPSGKKVGGDSHHKQYDYPFVHSFIEQIYLEGLR